MTLKKRLIEKLGGVDIVTAHRWEAEAEAKANAYYRGQIACYRDRIGVMAKQNNRLYKVVREICRCGNHSYYDWCCEYCEVECSERNGWCERFNV